MRINVPTRGEPPPYQQVGILTDTDDSELYKAVADPENRSICNVTFRLDDDEMEKRFLEQSLNEGLYALKGHRDVGGIRASIYNSMPLEGVKALADFMQDFERRET